MHNSRSSGYLYNYRILPNKNGIFKKINELFCDNTNSIPDIIIPIYTTIVGIEFNDIMIHQDINLVSLGGNITRKNFRNILDEFSEVFKNENGNEEKKKYLCKAFIGFAINDPTIRRMFNLTRETDENDMNVHQENLTNYYEQHMIWREVKEFWFEYHSKLIESKNNLSNLANLLYSNNNDESLNQCKIWLNNYLIFLRENYNEIEGRKIFPNQLGNFEKLENLQYDESIPEILKNIYNDLYSTNNERFEIRNKLLIKEITCYNTHNRFTPNEMNGKIAEKFHQSQNDIMKTSISERILSFLPNNNTNRSITISRAISEFIPYYNNIFNRNIILRQENGAELNYVIFLRYLLNKTLLHIQQMNQAQIPAKIEIISKIIKFAWRYQDNQFINLAVDPRNYQIFVNQNNRFKRIENIRFKDEFGRANNDDITNLFELARSPPIEYDFKNDFLSQIFADNLNEFRNRFSTKTLGEICATIENKLLEYFRNINDNNINALNHRPFRIVFFKLNEILKNANYLKQYFRGFMHERANIALKFLDIQDEMDNFIDDIKRIVEFRDAH